jgi:FkbM family methyltransferase
MIPSNASFKIRESFFWLIRIAFLAIGIDRERRFTFLTPGFVVHQRILDRKTRSIIKVEISSVSDLSTMVQIFRREAYGIERFNLGTDLNNRYQEIIESGKIPLILDLGGNTGLASVYFARTYPLSQILLVEPDLDNLTLAKKNTSTEKVTLIEGAIGAFDGTGNLIDPLLGNDAYRIERNDNGGTRIYSIQSLLLQSNLSKYVPFIVKIDIEGFELDLFGANTHWVELFPLIIIELHDWLLPSASTFLRAIAPLQRRFLHYGENIFSVKL